MPISLKEKICTCVLFLAACSVLWAFCPYADLSGDCKVDINDLVVFAESWLDISQSDANLAGSARIDFEDFIVLSSQWLSEGSQPVVINEIHYDPQPEVELVEFIELYNPSAKRIDISGWYFSDGVNYSFPSNTFIEPDGYVVVSQNPTAFSGKFQINSFGPFDGKFANEGEKVTLRNALGIIIDQIDYGFAFPWPTAASGDGSSMELINPSLDNDLGGSWRSSRYTIPPSAEPVYLVGSKSTQWHYRKGTSEPATGWQNPDYVEDATWLSGTAGFGYDNGSDYGPDLGTVLSMYNSFSSVYIRHFFEIPANENMPTVLRLRLYVDDGCIVWINGHEVKRFQVADGFLAYDKLGINHEASWGDSFDLQNPSSFLKVGQNIIAIHALNTRKDSSDFIIDAELLIPADTEDPTKPTPGRKNTSFASNAPPQIRQVEHSPQQPTTAEPVVIIAKVTDPDTVQSVILKYQIVTPGNYIPAFLPLSHAVLLADPERPFDPNPAFEDPANWINISMVDNGSGNDRQANDNIYTATVPAYAKNRTIVRYRIEVTDLLGASATVPYYDDPSLNFAYYVYNGVPPYTASYMSVHPEGAGHTYSADIMNSLPVYSLITRAADITECVAYNSAYQIDTSNDPARRKFNWEGAFFYDGVLYDHVHYRLRQANQRYAGAGKRAFRIQFNKGAYLQAENNYGEKYPTKWQTLNIGKMCDNLLNRGLFGLNEPANNILFNLVDVPAPWMHAFHFRVVDGPDEIPAGVNSQYYGDFWGLFLAAEDYDSKFLQAHNLPDGNLYRLKWDIFNGGRLKRNQGMTAVTDDSDFQNIRLNCDPDKDDAWLNRYVDYDQWYRYNTICEMVKHRDYNPSDGWLKNRAWFFTPYPGSGIGRLQTLPHDTDGSWAHNVWDGKGDYPEEAIYADHPGSNDPANSYWFMYVGVWPAKENFKLEHRNTMREIRDLLWTQAVINDILDDLAAFIKDFVPADRDRWKDAPADAGTQDWGTMEDRLREMKTFAFGASSRTEYIDSFINSGDDSVNIPNTPTVTYTGSVNYPANDLIFMTTGFSDPQGSGTFSAMRWRIAEITDLSNPTYNPAEPKKYEMPALWQSEDITISTQRTIKIPASVIKPGHSYRVRCKMKDNTNRWSHWSSPVQFIASEPLSAGILDNLRITELMYNPAKPAAGSYTADDFEYLELKNIGQTTLDLSGVSITNGVSFNFGAAEVRTLAAGKFVLVVKNKAAFENRYGTAYSLRIAGQFTGKLDNAGEQVTLVDYYNGVIADFEYGDGYGWPISADGGGHSLVPLASAMADQNKGSLQYGGNWRASAYINGSPGADDPAPTASVLINEVMAHTDYSSPSYPDYDSNDWIELYNPTGAAITLDGNWYLSDSTDNLRKWAIPAMTIPSHGWVSFDEVSGFHSPITSGFGLDKTGEQVFLSYLPGTSADCVIDSVKFGGQYNTVSLGRYPDGGTHWFTLTMPGTRNIANSGPAQRRVIISEVMYHPQEGTAKEEYVELYNPTPSAVAMNNTQGSWQLSNAVSYTFPAGRSIPANGRIVIVPFDPAVETARLSAFNAEYGCSLAANTTVLGPWTGNLSNGGERIVLQEPQEADPPQTLMTWWTTVDQVIYGDCSPWVEGPDGSGTALGRLTTAPEVSSDDPGNWTSITPSPGT